MILLVPFKVVFFLYKIQSKSSIQHVNNLHSTKNTLDKIRFVYLSKYLIKSEDIELLSMTQTYKIN